MNDLITPALAGDAAAMDELIQLGYTLVRIKANQRKWFLPGAEAEDLVQEVMFGFLDAIRRWDPRGTDFFTFARICVDCEFIETLKIYNRVKHRMLSEAVLLDAPDLRSEQVPSREDTRLSRWDLPDTSGLGRDPADLVGITDETATLVAAVSEGLTGLEAEVLMRVALDGERYDDVACELGRSVKSADNALQRARRKVRRLAGVLAEDHRFSEDTRALLRRVARSATKRRARKVNSEMVWASA